MIKEIPKDEQQFNPADQPLPIPVVAPRIQREPSLMSQIGKIASAAVQHTGALANNVAVAAKAYFERTPKQGAQPKKPSLTDSTFLGFEPATPENEQDQN